MRIDRTHPFNRDVDVYLDDERLLTCVWADDIEGLAEVGLTGEDGKLLWDEDAGRPVTQIRKGRVRFEPHKGFEDRFNWFQIGWAYGHEETLEKLKKEEKEENDAWGPEEISRLREMFQDRLPPREIAARLQRTENAVQSMIDTLELRKWFKL